MGMEYDRTIGLYAKKVDGKLHYLRVDTMDAVQIPDVIEYIRNTLTDLNLVGGTPELHLAVKDILGDGCD